MEEELKQSDPLPPEVEPAEELEPALPETQYCIFRAGRERFCFSVMDVEEVVEWPALTRIPLAPSFLMGIFNLRGAIVPVVDIAFTEARRPDLQPRHIVVAKLKKQTESEDIRIGVAADEVIGTFSTAEPLLADQAPLEVPHCCGLLQYEDRMALALDLQKLTEAFAVPVI
jgi:purine-binding chemotaxis protein CheW